MTTPLFRPPVADWELYVASRDDVLAYSVASNPQYWAALVRLPPLGRLEFSGQPPNRGWLIDVTYEARLLNVDTANVNTCGFVGGQLGYFNGVIFNAPSIAPSDFGSHIPTPLQAAPTAASESYDPAITQIAGADFPLWTRSTLDEMTVRTYLDDAQNPGYLWGIAFVQVNGAVNTMNAVTVESRMKWRPVS